MKKKQSTAPKTDAYVGNSSPYKEVGLSAMRSIRGKVKEKPFKGGSLPHIWEIRKVKLRGFGPRFKFNRSIKDT